MAKKLYVGNLTYGVTDSHLETLFAPHGTVQSAQVIMDRDTGRSKGFGFVEMDTSEEAQAAIAAMNGKDSDGRALTVNEARPPASSGQGLSVRDRWALMSEWPASATGQASQLPGPIRQG